MSDDLFARAIADADRLLKLTQINRELDELRKTIRTGRQVIKAEKTRQASTQPSTELASAAYEINRTKDPRR